MVRILVAEDDAMIVAALRDGLAQEGFAVDCASDGITAVEALAVGTYDLMLLDLGLPRRSGLEILRKLRASDRALPVLIVTARDDLPDRVQGLDAGADDYLVKPFDLDELLARVRALLRRPGHRASPVLRWGPLTLDPSSRRVEHRGRAIALTRREYALLLTLMQRPRSIFSRSQLEESLYGWDTEVDSNAIEVHIHGLRRKLGPAAVRTIRGIGYGLGEQP